MSPFVEYWARIFGALALLKVASRVMRDAEKLLVSSSLNRQAAVEETPGTPGEWPIKSPVVAAQVDAIESSDLTDNEVEESLNGNGEHRHIGVEVPTEDSPDE